MSSFVTRFSVRPEGSIRHQAADVSSDQIIAIVDHLRSIWPDLRSVGENLFTFTSDEKGMSVANTFTNAMRFDVDSQNVSWLQPVEMRKDRNGGMPLCLSDHEFDLYAVAGGVVDEH